MAHNFPQTSQQFKLTGVNINSVADTLWTGVFPSKYIIKGFYVTNPSKSLAASIATLGLCGSAGGAAPVIVTPAVLTTLALSSDLLSMTLLLTTKVRTESTLYVRCAIADGGAATVDVVLDILPFT